ncbi:HTH-type transcriptional activator AllS [Pinisolibacter aquiterrae]|jgi:LysR family transcriptional activator of the allD operon|uniref:HTH-type transcriptional activator AllS n=1 Tax=Pinisolibacter aquiterrae TaxID=2815579 RepID=UPI001C3D111C|nr:HTH-type transcriptional activator AllS [Pinisolibacter aquiterrae]MBV5266908.1 HTH-type transcriptional activator AllS [Pinisolibacter aquiterrae]MCC8234781.1 HTH-type transcriptional activator AllS [Pinisolibacter aquiterrae]
METRLPNLDLEAVRTFVAVARLKSFSAAAQELHRTTSAVSYRIKTLEDGIGTPLFVRTTRNVTLTPAGHVLLDKAGQIFEWLQGLPDELRQVGENVEPRFTLVINNLLYDSDATARLLAHLNRSFPHTEIEIRSAVYMGVWDELLHNGVHMALGAPGFHTINDDFETHPLGAIHWVFVIAPDHPLAGHSEPLSNDELRRFPAVNVEDTATRLVKRVAWRLAGQKEMLVPDLRTKLVAHISGVGVGFLPTTMAREHVRAGRLVERRVVQGRSPSPLSLVWRRNHNGRVAAHLRELVLANSEHFAFLADRIGPEVDR